MQHRSQFNLYGGSRLIIVQCAESVQNFASHLVKFCTIPRGKVNFANIYETSRMQPCEYGSFELEVYVK